MNTNTAGDAATIDPSGGADGAETWPGMAAARRRHLLAAVHAGVRAAAELVGFDPDTPALEGLPGRWLQTVHDLAAVHTPDHELARFLAPVPVGSGPGAPDHAGPVYAGPAGFTTLCERHMMPWRGVLHAAHVPRPGATVSVLPARLEYTGRYYAAGLTTPRRIAVTVAEVIRARLAGVGGACTVTVAEPCAGGSHDRDATGFPAEPPGPAAAPPDGPPDRAPDGAAGDGVGAVYAWGVLAVPGAARDAFDAWADQRAAARPEPRTEPAPDGRPARPST